jgi:patatin-like phospholipase/acyl hydrolase
LSIDGGGIRGVLPASVLTEFEARHCEGRSIGDFFDMIVGTSTGGIIALGLASGLSAARVLEIYMKHGSEIFPSPRRLRRLRKLLRAIGSLTRYQYEREPLERHLRAVFANSTLGETARRVCVPSFDGFTEVNVFKTPHHPDFKMDWREEMVTIALATSAAPTFFSIYANGNRRFADGGVWANNPIMIGLIDALTCYELDQDQIDILSLGCGESEMLMTDKQISMGGLWHWKNIIASAMHLASQNALGQAGLLIGRDRLLRIDAPGMTDAIGLDDAARAITELPPIAKQLASENDEIVAERFLSSVAQPYRAYYGPRAIAV